MREGPRALRAGYRVVPAQRDHLAHLAAVERAAATRFAEADLPSPLRDETLAPEELAEAQADGRLWVALAPDGEPVGFALACLVDGASYLEEIDVDPRHAQRGLGTALVRAACDWARAHGHRTLSLVTYRHLPWNAPWYGRLGFRVLSRAELGPGLREILEDDARRGLDPARRVAMRCDLDARRGGAGSPPAG